MANSLGGVPLPDNLVWIDELDWDPVAQAQDRATNGALHIQESSLLAGRPMTLAGAWISRETAIALRALSATPSTNHTLVLRGESTTVRFRRPSMQLRQLFDTSEPENGDDVELTLNLMQV